jgi:hypothetical protein
MAEDGGNHGFELALDRSVEAVFQSYAEGFDDFDADRILACFAFPATIWQGNVFTDAEDLAENVDALLDVFEREEIVRSSYSVLETVLSGPAAFVTLAWRQDREDGEAALEFTCHYTLHREHWDTDEPGDWRIVLAVNE